MTPSIAAIVTFLQDTFARTGSTKAVIAVSGGIDSAVALSLLARALSPQAIFPLLLPYGSQDMTDAHAVCSWNQIPAANVTELNIETLVAAIDHTLQIPAADALRRGNVMARVRMIALYDTAKKLDALVVGTENKSEHYLGYFTRFGDAASDLEPIAGFYKTQVREIALELGIPSAILTKAPSAGLWAGQTDEDELGFSYEQADRVLVELIDKKIPVSKIVLPDISTEIVQQIAARVASQAFKLQVPYLPT